MRRRASAESGFRWTLLVGALMLALAALPTAGCGGGDETTTTATAAEAETTESTEAVATTDAATGVTEGAGAAEGAADPAAAGDPFASFEILEDVPDDYPDLELPPNTELLQARGGEIDPGTGEMTYIVVAAYDSETPAPEQYDHWKQYVAGSDYEFIMDQMFEDPVYTFVMQIANADWSITVVGGDDDSEFIAEFPDAVHPFALVVAPAYLTQ
jgi:hypothetical protein